jgi:hypothetical protein
MMWAREYLNVVKYGLRYVGLSAGKLLELEAHGAN